MKKLITIILLASTSLSAETKTYDIDNDTKKLAEASCLMIGLSTLPPKHQQYLTDIKPNVMGFTSNEIKSVGVFFKLKEARLFGCIFKNNGYTLQLGMFGQKPNMTTVSPLY